MSDINGNDNSEIDLSEFESPLTQDDQIAIRLWLELESYMKVGFDREEAFQIVFMGEQERIGMVCSIRFEEIMGRFGKPEGT